LTKHDRRTFIKNAAIGAGGISLATGFPEPLRAEEKKDLFCKLAVPQFSFASQFWTIKLDSLDFGPNRKSSK
jgi:hypothetical protein